MSKDFYSITEAAAIIGLAPSTLERRAKRGDIPSQRVGIAYALSAETVEAERARVAGKTSKKAPDTHTRRGNWATIVKPAPRPDRTMAEVEATAVKYTYIGFDGTRQEVQRGTK